MVAASRSSTRACWSRTSGSRPYCPRCGTGLSDHELAAGLRDRRRPVGVRPASRSPRALRRPAAMLVWTTTPWTLVPATRGRRAPGRHLRRRSATAPRRWSSPSRWSRRPRRGLDGARRAFTGAEMERWTYQRPFDARRVPGRAHFVVTWRVRHHRGRNRAGAPGARVRRRRLEPVRRAYGLPLVNPDRRPTARFEPRIRARRAGMFFKDADEPLVADLRRARPAVRATSAYEHSYPHCWRCHTPLLYYAQPSWYIRTTAASRPTCCGRTRRPTGTRRRSSTAGTATGCTTTSTGRCRAAGTGARRCRSGAATPTTVDMVASARWPSLCEPDRAGPVGLDPHRPLRRRRRQQGRRRRACTAASREVIDAWFDSGSMPFAQFGLPCARTPSWSS